MICEKCKTKQSKYQIFCSYSFGLVTGEKTFQDTVVNVCEDCYSPASKKKTNMPPPAESLIERNKILRRLQEELLKEHTRVQTADFHRLEMKDGGTTNGMIGYEKGHSDGLRYAMEIVWKVFDELHN